MEFLRYLFEAMEKSFLHRFQGQKYVKKIVDGEDIISKFVIFCRIDNRSKETTPLNQIFGGYIRTEGTI
jgi:ubiquitin carboxyl-terminal hydrolase 36/42